MGVFDTAHKIVEACVRGEGVNVGKLFETEEGDSAWRVYNEARNFASEGTKLSQGDVMSEKGEKAVTQVLKTFRRLTVGGWTPKPGEPSTVVRRYVNGESVKIAGNILALCGISTQSSGNVIEMHANDHERWEKAESIANDLGGRGAKR